MNKNTVKEGDKVKVTVITSDDVDYITINGMVITSYKTDKLTGERIWTLDVHAEKVGKMTIVVVAYNAEGVSSLMKFQFVTVEAKGKLNPGKNNGRTDDNDVVPGISGIIG